MSQDKAGQTMAEIVTSIGRVTEIMTQISNASDEQSQGIGQINSAVTELDRMTQQNAALVEQSAAAAESLKDQAQRLTESMQVFRLSGGPATLGAAVPARPAPAAARVLRRRQPRCPRRSRHPSRWLRPSPPRGR